MGVHVNRILNFNFRIGNSGIVRFRIFRFPDSILCQLRTNLLVASGLFAGEVNGVLLILGAVVVQQIGTVGHQNLIQLDRPGGRICLGIINGEHHFHISMIDAVESLRYLCGAGQRTAVSIEPCSVLFRVALLEANGLNDQRIAVPGTGRKTVERRQIHFGRQWPAIGVDLTERGISFEQYDEKARSLDELSSKWVGVQFHQTARDTA